MQNYYPVQFKWPREVLIFFACVLGLGLFIASASAVILPDRAKLENLKAQAVYLPDPDGQFTPEMLLSDEHPFVPYNTEFDQSAPPMWVKLVLRPGQAPHIDHVLHIKRRYFQRLDVHFRQGERNLGSYYHGIENYEPRTSYAQDIIYPIVSDRSEPVTALIYVKTIQGTLSPFEVSIQPRTSFQEYKLSSQLIFGAYFGAMLAMVIYNLVIVVTVRSAGHMLYVGAMTFTMLWAALDSGNMDALIPDFFLQRGPMSELLFGLLVLATTMRFYQVFVNTRKFAPKAHPWFSVLASIFCLLAMAAVLLPVRYAAHLAFFAQAAQSLAWLSILVVGIVAAFRGSRSAPIFLAAWLLLIAGTMARILSSAGALPREVLGDYGPYAGSFLQAMLLAIGLAAQIRRLRDERDRAVRGQLRAARLANLDPLTGAYNRRFFDSYLRESQEDKDDSPPRVALILVDLDFFKDINDRFGHSVGDQVLKAFTQRCQSSLRPTDVFARIGGEEFAIALLDQTGLFAYQLAERLRAEVNAHPMTIAGHQVDLSFSAGVTDTSLSSASYDNLFRDADWALYRAKTNGRNQVVLFDLDEKLREEREGDHDAHYQG